MGAGVPAAAPMVRVSGAETVRTLPESRTADTWPEETAMRSPETSWWPTRAASVSPSDGRTCALPLMAVTKAVAWVAAAAGLVRPKPSAMADSAMAAKRVEGMVISTPCLSQEECRRAEGQL